MADKKKINLVPTKGMKSAAEKGLRWHSEGLSGDGLEEATVTRAKKIISAAQSGENLTPKHVKRMHSFFERHANGRSKTRDGVTPWDVAWALWGGDAGRTWSAKKVEQLGENDG